MDFDGVTVRVRHLRHGSVSGASSRGTRGTQGTQGCGGESQGDPAPIEITRG